MLHIKVHFSPTQQSLIIEQQLENGHHKIIPSYTFEKTHKDQKNSTCITQCLSRKTALH